MCPTQQEIVMGLLDSVIGALGNNASGGGGGQGELISAVIGMLAQGGGLSGLMEKMQQGGLGEIASSWVGTGQNMPIGADQLEQVLGNDTVSSMAGQLGVNHGDLLGQLSKMLPQLVDGLTPQGQIPQGDLGGILGGVLGGGGGGAQQGGPDLGALAGMLGGMLGKR
jgi:uncharacterized protein YidB (DUF937 family)